MAVRLKIGAYILDADANSSTTAGTTLHPDSSAGLDSTSEYITWSGTSDQVTIPFWVKVTGGGSESTLNTRLKLVEDAIQEPSGDVVYEYSDTNTLREWKTSNGDYTIVTGTVKTYPGETDALLECALTLSRPGVTGSAPRTSDGSDTAIPGLVDTVTVTGERVIAGRLNMVIEANFKDGGDTSVTVSSVASNGTLAEFFFSGSPDLSGIVTGQLLSFTGGSYSGTHAIVSVDDAGDSVVTQTTFVATATGSGTIKGSTSEDNARSFIARIRDRGAPVSLWPWLPGSTAMRVVDDVVQADLTSQDSSGNRTVGGTSRATIVMREIPGDLTALNSKIRDIQATIGIAHRALDARASGTTGPGIDVTLTGAIYTRTEANTSWDAGDTGSVAELTDTELNTALDLLRDEAISRLDTRVSTIKELNRNTSRGVETGEITFLISMVSSDTTVLEWDEEITFKASSNTSIVPDAEGVDWVYDQAAPGILTVEHNLRVVRLDSAPSYKEPPSVRIGKGSRNWLTIEAAQTTAKTTTLRGSFGDGAAHTTVERRFRYIYRAIRTERGLGGSIAGDIRTVISAIKNNKG